MKTLITLSIIAALAAAALRNADRPDCYALCSSASLRHESLRIPERSGIAQRKDTHTSMINYDIEKTVVSISTNISRIIVQKFGLRRSAEKGGKRLKAFPLRGGSCAELLES